MNLAERLAKYAAGLRYEDIDGDTITEAKKRIVDALGCAIGAYRERPVRLARSAAERICPRGPSTILGSSGTSSPDVATFVNGLMIRYFDFNDTYLSREPAHPSDNLGACLAVAESEGCGGRELILALVLAYEVQCRLCDAADLRHRGWDHVCYGLVSSSLAAGRLMGLTAGGLAQAVNISLNGHIAMRQVRAGELTMWKGASFSNAARNAVFAAALAREGMEGPSPIFEGEMGFFRQVSGPFDLDVRRFGGRGGRFKLGETYIKFYPAEYHAQSAISAALELRDAVTDLSGVRSVVVETHEAGYTILGKDPEKWRPSTKETADHSLPYIVAVALLKGEVDNASYSPRSLKDKDVLGLLGRITVREDRRLTSLYPAQGMANRITVKLAGGESVTREVLVPKGHPKNPMSADEVEAKFRRLTSGLLPKGRAESLLEGIWHLEDEKDLSAIVSDMKVSG